MTWRDHGLCGQTDPELFFDDSEDGIANAKSVCGGCPVRDSDCLADALTNGSTVGVQAGLTAEERKNYPGFVRAHPVSDFAPVPAEELTRRWEAEQATLRRRAAAEAQRRDNLTHPFDLTPNRKASS